MLIFERVTGLHIVIILHYYVIAWTDELIYAQK